MKKLFLLLIFTVSLIACNNTSLNPNLPSFNIPNIDLNNSIYFAVSYRHEHSNNIQYFVNYIHISDNIYKYANIELKNNDTILKIYNNAYVSVYDKNHISIKINDKQFLIYRNNSINGLSLYVDKSDISVYKDINTIIIRFTA